MPIVVDYNPISTALRLANVAGTVDKSRYADTRGDIEFEKQLAGEQFRHQQRALETQTALAYDQMQQQRLLQGEQLAYQRANQRMGYQYNAQAAEQAARQRQREMEQQAEQFYAGLTEQQRQAAIANELARQQMAQRGVLEGRQLDIDEQRAGTQQYQAEQRYGQPQSIVNTPEYQAAEDMFRTDRLALANAAKRIEDMQSNYISENSAEYQDALRQYQEAERNLVQSTRSLRQLQQQATGGVTIGAGSPEAIDISRQTASPEAISEGMRIFYGGQ